MRQRLYHRVHIALSNAPKPRLHFYSGYNKLSIQRFCAKSLASNKMLKRQIKEDAFQKIASYTFEDMVNYTTPYLELQKNQNEQHLIELTEFVRKQLLILVANIINDFDNLPYSVNENERIKEIVSIYYECYDAVKSINSITNVSTKNKFVKIVNKYTKIGRYIVPKLVICLKEMTQQQKQESRLYKIDECPYLTNFIDIIIRRRMAIRTILGHYLSLYNGEWGIFEQNTDIMKYVNTAVDDSITVAKDTYGDDIDIPYINVIDMRKYETQDFTFMPEIIYQCLFELIKNSIRSTIDCHRLSSDILNNDINIIVVNSKIDGQITIKIADKGGGIKHSEVDRIWFYTYTSSSSFELINNKTQAELLNDVNQCLNIKPVCSSIDAKPMYGLGYGLPVLRAKIKYFGGDCKINSIYTYGTDAYILFPNLKTSKQKALVVTNVLKDY